MLILLAWRDGIADSDRMRLLVAEARRSSQSTSIELQRLDSSATAELVMGMAGDLGVLPDGFGERLHTETDGLPLLLVEYLLSGIGGDVGVSLDWEVPITIRRLLHSRVSGVSETGRQILDTAAVIGYRFDFETVQQASGRHEEEAVDGIEELVGSRLVMEVNGDGPPVYDFAHDQLRVVVYDNISLARRRLIHRRIAEAIASRPVTRHLCDSSAAIIAGNYQMAGRDAESAEYYKRAGEHARGLFANVEAMSHFRVALELGHPSAVELHEKLGDLHTLLGEYGSALESYEAAAALSDSEHLAIIERKIGSVHHRKGEWGLADNYYQSALDLLEKSDSEVELAKLYTDWSLNAHRNGDGGRAAELGQQAVELAETTGDVRATAQAHNMLGVLARNRGDYETARSHLKLCLDLAASLADPSVRIAALNNLALAHRANHNYEEAVDLTETAVSLCREGGDKHKEAALHNNLADLYHSVGKAEEAMRHLELAVTIFSEIGADAGAMLPEVWKLVEW